MSKRKMKTADDEAVRAASATECTGLMPTPAEEKEERLSYSEIETLQTGETLRHRQGETQRRSHK